MTFHFFYFLLIISLDFLWAHSLFWNWIKIWGFLATENGGETRSLFIRRMTYRWAKWGEWPLIVSMRHKYALNFGSRIFQNKKNQCIHSWFIISRKFALFFILNKSHLLSKQFMYSSWNCSPYLVGSNLVGCPILNEVLPWILLP